VSPERVAPATSPAGRWVMPAARAGGVAVASAAAPPDRPPSRTAPPNQKDLETPRPQSAGSPTPPVSPRWDDGNPFAHLLGGTPPAGSPKRPPHNVYATATARAAALPPVAPAPAKSHPTLRLVVLAIGLLALAAGAFAAWRLMLGWPAGWW